jgi:hypothetical protein
VESALTSASAAGVTVKVRVADLEKAYRIRETSYDLIICFNYLQRSLIPQMKAGLTSGGMVVYETFIIDQAQFGKPRNPDFLLQHFELMDLFRELRCLRYREGLLEGPRAIASIVAQKI